MGQAALLWLEIGWWRPNSKLFEAAKIALNRITTASLIRRGFLNPPILEVRPVFGESFSLFETNIAIDNGPFIVDLP